MEVAETYNHLNYKTDTRLCPYMAISTATLHVGALSVASGIVVNFVVSLNGPRPLGGEAML